MAEDEKKSGGVNIGSISGVSGGQINVAGGDIQAAYNAGGGPDPVAKAFESLKEQVKKVPEIQRIMEVDHSGPRMFPHLGDCFLWERGQLKSKFLCRIGCEYCVSAGAGDDSQTVSAHLGKGKALQYFQRFSLFTCTHNPALAKRRIHHPVIAG